MTSISDIRRSIQPEIEKLNSLIKDSLDSSNDLMNRVISSYLEHKGKQLRPMLVMLTAKLFGDINDSVIKAAASVEMLHNASLIHDDVVDESKTRHGHDTINAVWDNHIAVLVGDFFVSNALQLAITTDDLRVIGTIASLGKLLSLGEMDQIYNARFHKLDEEAYFKIISHKTASLFVSCVSVGAYCVGVDDERLTKMRRFAELFGLCFQIRDDIFDYFSDEKIGKPTGNDLREGKITLPLLYALTKGKDEKIRKEMTELSHKEFLTEAEIGSLIEYAKDNGGIEYADDTMLRLRDEAAEILSSFPATEATEALLALLDFIIRRDN
ncbi:MAG: polyprenyl synthetase family protein [Muribaculum sp.]|nr:polyprenyl synthetase family protein [Muribaculum sp.]